LITIIAKLQAAPGKEEELKAALEEMVAAVKANEAGKVLAYSLHTSDKNPGQFVFYEQYRDAEALKEHGATPHMAAMNEKIVKGQLLAGRPEIERYTQIAGIS